MAKQETPKERRTLIKIARQCSEYVSGVGNKTTWKKIAVRVGSDENGEIMTDCFYCEWLNSFGNVAIQQQADGIKRVARLRMTYVPAVYEALTSNDNVKVYLHGIEDDAHAYVLATSCDNYLNENKMLEFSVKKFEGK